MDYNFDEIIERRNTDSIKWDFGDALKEMGLAERFDQDTLPLFTADMDIAVPPAIVEAMHRTADRRIYGYTMAPQAYYDSIIDWFKRRHDWEIRTEEILHSPGTVHALGVAVRAFTDKGDGVIIQRPVYPPFTRTIEENDRVVANNQMLLDEQGNYSIDMDGFEALAKQPQNKLFILCNPQNPTGRIFSNDELRTMARICEQNDVVIIADEIHGDLIRCDHTFTPLVKVADSVDHIVTCTAINKTFNVAGLHATNMVIHNKVLRDTFAQELGKCLPTPFTVNAVIAAYNECEQWLEALKVYLDDTFAWALDFIQTHMPKVKCTRSEGTYILWMDFSDYGITAEEIRKRIYVDANVILESGEMFDPDQGAGFERICLSSPRPIIKEAFERIARAFSDL